jgi:hypothetical protein
VVNFIGVFRGLLFVQLQGAAQLGTEEGRREQEEGPGSRVQAPGRSEEGLHRQVRSSLCYSYLEDKDSKKGRSQKRGRNDKGSDKRGYKKGGSAKWAYKRWGQ